MKNKTIIALQGDQDSGKSLTIGLLLKLMEKDGFLIFQDKKRKNSKDFFAMVGKNGFKIGICSYGDTAYLIEDRCGRFVDAKCDIIICACHNSGKTVDAVTGFKRYTPEFVKKTIESTSKHQNANNADAIGLLTMVNNFIS